MLKKIFLKKPFVTNLSNAFKLKIDSGKNINELLFSHNSFNFVNFPILSGNLINRLFALKKVKSYQTTQNFPLVFTYRNSDTPNWPTAQWTRAAPWCDCRRARRAASRTPLSSNGRAAATGRWAETTGGSGAGWTPTNAEISSQTIAECIATTLQTTNGWKRFFCLGFTNATGKIIVEQFNNVHSMVINKKSLLKGTVDEWVFRNSKIHY